MNCNGDVATNWKVFRVVYQEVTLKTVMGKECKQILNRLGLTTTELKQTDTIMTKLEAHFTPAHLSDSGFIVPSSDSGSVSHTFRALS